MTHPWVDLSVIVSKNRRVVNPGRPVSVPVRKKNPTGYNSAPRFYETANNRRITYRGFRYRL
jgi:hypothetical protein